MAFQYVIVKNSGRGRGYLPTIMPEASDFITNASHVFEGNKQAKEARRKEDSLKKEKDQMLKTIGQLTLERNFLQGCFHQCGREVPRLDSEDV